MSDHPQPTPTNRPGNLIGYLSKRAADGPINTGPAPIVEVDIDLLDPNPDQPRREFDPDELRALAGSIKLHGVIQPITITRQTNADGFGRFYIIAGERRTRAMRLLRDEATDANEKKRYSRIICTDRGETNSAQLAELALTENLLRSDLHPIETAEAIAQLQEREKLETAASVAARLALDTTKTKRYLQLAKAPPAVRQALSKGLMVELEDKEEGGSHKEHRQLDFFHALQVLRLYRHLSTAKPKRALDDLRALVERVLREGWPLVRLEQHVDAIVGKASRQKPPPADEPNTPEEESSSSAGPAQRPAFENDAHRLVLHHQRLTHATSEERERLRTLLSSILASL